MLGGTLPTRTTTRVTIPVKGVSAMVLPASKFGHHTFHRDQPKLGQKSLELQGSPLLN